MDGWREGGGRREGGDGEEGAPLTDIMFGVWGEVLGLGCGVLDWNKPTRSLPPSPLLIEHNQRLTHSLLIDWPQLLLCYDAFPPACLYLPASLLCCVWCVCVSFNLLDGWMDECNVVVTNSYMLLAILTARSWWPACLPACISACCRHIRTSHDDNYRIITTLARVVVTTPHTPSHALTRAHARQNSPSIHPSIA
mmetsp:Transcript_3895/g.9826  ORF Transcript_3895/g.9826 Transcript_3895/m.9826 type:complete len:195 (-) Transcript_3895:327-911(-)